MVRNNVLRDLVVCVRVQIDTMQPRRCSSVIYEEYIFFLLCSKLFFVENIRTYKCAVLVYLYSTRIVIVGLLYRLDIYKILLSNK